MHLKSMKVGTRLGFGFSMALILSIVITTISSIINIKGMLHADSDSPKLVTLMDASLAGRMIALRNLALLVEQAATATQSMQDQAGNLLQMVGMFRLDRISAA